MVYVEANFIITTWAIRQREITLDTFRYFLLDFFQWNANKYSLKIKNINGI